MQTEETGTFSLSTQQTPVKERQDENEVILEEPAKVILYNDEVHTFDEVTGQIIKAIRCDPTKAEALTWEVHTRGKAMIFEGPMTECLQVSHVLEEIALHTQIEV